MIEAFQVATRERDLMSVWNGSRPMFDSMRNLKGFDHRCPDF